MGKIKELFGNMFGKKSDPLENEPIHRIEPRPEPTEEEEAGQRWKLAKRMREEREMNEPLVKRKRF